MESAIFGLVGVIVGALLTAIREAWFQRKKMDKEREYLAIRVAGELEAYVAGCREVAGDDGLYRGQTDKDGFHKIQVQAPTLDLGKLDVEWKSLDVSLMYKILDFPSQIARAESHVDASDENAFPPDFDEFFEERQYQYSLLGLSASSLAARLRANVGLPPKPEEEGDFTMLNYMRRVVTDSEQRRREWRQSPWNQVPVIDTKADD